MSDLKRIAASRLAAPPLSRVDLVDELTALVGAYPLIRGRSAQRHWVLARVTVGTSASET